MDKHILLSMGLPMRIRSRAGKLATVEMNKGFFVVCRFHPNNSIYLNDANLQGWYPAHYLSRIIYVIKNKLRQHA